MLSRADRQALDRAQAHLDRWQVQQIDRAHAHIPRVAAVMLATVMGVLLALAIVHWIELEGLTGPAGTAKAGALGLLAMPQRWLRRYWLWASHHVRLDVERRQLKWVEDDIRAMEEELAFLPSHIRYLRGEAQRLRVVVALREKHGPNELFGTWQEPQA